MLPIDLTGRRALVAGVADDHGYGFAIAKALAEAGATVCVATWPPALTIFRNLLDRGKMDESRALRRGGLLEFERVYPLDAVYDTLDDAPPDVRENKRYKEQGDFSVQGVADRLTGDFGERPLDVLVHAIGNAPEVRKPLLEVSRGGYLAAVSASAYSLVSLVQRLGPLMRPGGSAVSLTYMASERVVPGYGGGMPSAKAALESDTRVLAYEAGASSACASTPSRPVRWRAAPRAPSASSNAWSSTPRATRRSPSPRVPRRSARRRPSSRARSAAGSPARPSTWTGIPRDGADGIGPTRTREAPAARTSARPAPS
jgi:enoyl-[acyl-carrier protein] reductase I